jgi:hypothetical protein
MATPTKVTEINFTLKVNAKSTNRPDGPIDFVLDLNPDGKLLQIGDGLSRKRDLIKIFLKITRVLLQIDRRIRNYNDAVIISRKKLQGRAFTEDAGNGVYDNNIKPPFERIDKIIYSHHSPGAASVSFASSYNGDQRPPL